MFDLTNVNHFRLSLASEIQLMGSFSNVVVPNIGIQAMSWAS